MSAKLSTPERPAIKPRMPIRRFDVFAEYNRQKASEDGMVADEARGYGLWLAKVVAARRFGRALLVQPPSRVREMAPREPEEADRPGSGKWRTLDGKPQTDALFEKEIVERMGRSFYEQVFAPAIHDALGRGESYTAIRDTLRRDWKP